MTEFPVSKQYFEPVQAESTTLLNGKRKPSMLIHAAVAIVIAILFAHSAKAQLNCGMDILKTQRHSLAMALSLVNPTYLTAFTGSMGNQNKPSVQATPLKYVCPDVWNSFWNVYNSSYDAGGKAAFVTAFQSMGSQIANLSPAGSYSAGNCPQGLEIADLLR